MNGIVAQGFSRDRGALIVLLSVLLAACGNALGPQETPAAGTFITRERAVAAALKIASSSAPEVSGALVKPSNIRAERMTLVEAMRLMLGSADVPKGYVADTPVWYVTMDGLWASEVEAPGVTATQIPYHHYSVILEAITGKEIESSLRP